MENKGHNKLLNKYREVYNQIMAKVYGIGNPLIDYLCSIDDRDLTSLSLNKCTMLLIDNEKQKWIIELGTSQKKVGFLQKEVIFLHLSYQ